MSVFYFKKTSKSDETRIFLNILNFFIYFFKSPFSPFLIAIFFRHFFRRLFGDLGFRLTTKLTFFFVIWGNFFRFGFSRSLNTNLTFFFAVWGPRQKKFSHSRTPPKLKKINFHWDWRILIAFKSFWGGADAKIFSAFERSRRIKYCFIFFNIVL